MRDKPTDGYREKYLQLLKEQETSEKQFSLQLDLLRKTLLRVGVTAQGLDKQVDATFNRLKETMRGGSGAQVYEQIERVQNASDEFELKRAEENLKAARQMSALVEQYLALQIPSELKQSLKSFSKSLVTRLANYRQYPSALEDLVKLQQLCLEAASKPKANFWQRVKGGVTLEPDQPDKVSASEVKEAELAEKATPSRDIGVVDDEDSYDQVAARIASTLESLVEKIEPNDIIKHKVDIVRHRIERGMDWFSLAVTLEDIRDILFLRYLQADEEFSDYLNKVRSELESIRESLGVAVDQDTAQNEAVDTFSNTVDEHVGNIRKSLNDSQTMDELKSEVTGHITYIHEALQVFRQSQSNEASLTEQLQALVSRVKSVESESEKTKDLLEEQRYKATHDPLTGLPNREAYTERAFQELQRFKRYPRPLTMAVCDIDYFKKINDNYGHQAGDKVLKLIAKVVSTRLRSVDFVARIGGEEFVILMPETSTSQAHTVLDKIRAAVGKTPFRFKEDPVKITISFGLAGFRPEDTVESVFERADRALYQAKDEGRNRCVVDDAQ